MLRIGVAQAAPSTVDCSASAVVESSIGPTPYPADVSAMPGRGLARVYGWMIDNRKSFWRRRGEDRCSVVFIGDSLIAQWASIKQDFAPIKVANRGIGGDGSRGALFRFDEDVLSLAPKAVVILVGTNDLSAKQSVADIVSNIDDMIAMVRARQDDTPVVLCTVPPRDDPHAPIDKAELKELNRRLLAMASQPHVLVVDVNKQLTAPDGSPDPDYFQIDMLHMNPQAYRRIRQSLLPVLETLNVR